MQFANIRDFGAKGDGQTDDTAALMAAMEQAAREGGAVYFPMGYYRIRPVKVPSHITLLGNASWGYTSRGGQEGLDASLPGNAIRPEAGKPGIGHLGSTVLCPLQADAPALLDLSQARGTRIIGLSFYGDGKGDNFHCVDASGAPGPRNLVFEDVRVSNFKGTALKLDHVEGFAIRRCIFIANGGHAVDASAAQDGSIIDNQLSFNGGAGLYATAGTQKLTVTGNRIEGGAPGGVYAADSQGISVTGNSFDFCRGAGVTFLRCVGCTATGNMFRASGRTRRGEENAHLHLEGGCGLAVIGNTLWAVCPLASGEYTQYGMILRELTDSVVMNNAMFDSCTDEFLRDYGGHQNTLILQNQGRIHEIEPA